MPAVARLFVAAFLTDCSLYLAFAALPFRALELGAGSTGLGILPTLYAVAYMATASLAGRWSDRVPRLTLARAGAALFFLGCLALSRAPNRLTLSLCIPVLGLGLGFFWSPVQAALADLAGPGRLSRAVMGFNVGWSLGKGAGLVTGGLLTERLDPSWALLASGAPVLLTMLILPWGKGVVVASAAPPGTPPATAPAPPAVRPPAAPVAGPLPAREPSERFLKTAWLTNAIAFGIGSTMNVHAPKFLLARGAGPGEFGVVLGMVFLAQTFTFIALADSHPRRRALVLASAAGLVGLAGFLLAPSTVWRIVAVLPLGVCLGLAYQASIHASLDRGAGRGRAAGLHEMLLGAGSSSLPLLGGAVATATGSLAAPLFVASGALLFGLIVTRVFRDRDPAR